MFDYILSLGGTVFVPIIMALSSASPGCRRLRQG